MGAPIVIHPRCYPWLCTEVLNAIIHYKDTIGNSMARVLCSATLASPPPPSFSVPTRFSFLVQGTVKVISGCNTCIPSSQLVIARIAHSGCRAKKIIGPNWTKLFFPHFELIWRFNLFFFFFFLESDTTFYIIIYYFV